jgi:cytochrome c oxidase cbb3-type subunit I/II
MKPLEMIPQTIMPAYTWLADKEVNLNIIPKKIRVMQTLGVPYEKDYDKKAIEDYNAQAKLIVEELKASGVTINPNSEMVAIIAYLHKLGKDISPAANKIK